jgi:DNA-binding MarR family transcriptional regulator
MATPRWLDETEARAWRGHLRMTWLLNAAIERDLLRQAGLSHPDYYVLVSLSEAEGCRLRMSELAAGIEWSKSRLSHQVARMEARGLVRREDCPGDARGTFAVLTPAGRRAIEEAAPDHVESIRRHLLDVLTAAQVEALAAISHTVIEHLGDDRPAVCQVEEPTARKRARTVEG